VDARVEADRAGAAILVREAGEADAPAIARVNVASWRSTYRDILPASLLASLSATEQTRRWAERLGPFRDRNVAVVAEEQGRVVAYASGGAERGGDPDYLGELYAIYILKTHQRRGIGARMVAQIAGRLHERGFETMLVWVLRDNPSRAFYESLGGVYLREQALEMGSVVLAEVAYGWNDISSLIPEHSSE
jgi:GNAT superfamily N-acetyltransferase